MILFFFLLLSYWYYTKALFLFTEEQERKHRAHPLHPFSGCVNIMTSLSQRKGGSKGELLCRDGDHPSQQEEDDEEEEQNSNNDKEQQQIAVKMAVLVSLLKCLKSINKSIFPLVLANRHSFGAEEKFDYEEFEEVTKL